MIQRRAVLLAGLLWIVMAIAAFAATGPDDLIDEIKRDFAPMSGYVVMPAEGEFLIDRGAVDGISNGDLFSVVRPGEKVLHPVTGEVLGTLDHVKGFLQVTGVQPRYSRARALDVNDTFEKGDIIRRFDRIPVAFIDATGGERAFYERLRSAIPGLKWRSVAGPASAEAALPDGAMLLFVLERDVLWVRGSEGFIHSYVVAHGAEKPSASTPLAAAGPSAKGVAPDPAASPAEIKPSASAAFGDFSAVGSLPEQTLMADFIRDGERLLLATTDGTRIDVFAVEPKLTRIAEGIPPRSARVYSLHWWRPQPAGRLMLAATVAAEANQAYSPTIGKSVFGVVFAFEDSRLTRVPDEIPYLLGTFDRNGDGVPETLLGQNFDRDIVFGDRIREIHLRDGKLVVADPSFPLPRPFSIQATASSDLTGDGRSEAVSIYRRKLYVYDGTKLLYESQRLVGGSLSKLMYAVNPDAKDQLFDTATFDVPPVTVQFNDDGSNEVLVITTNGGTLGIDTGIRTSSLATLAYRDGRFVWGTLGPELEGAVAGLYVGKRGVFVVATSRTSGWGKSGGESQLLFLPVRAPEHERRTSP